MSKKINSNLVLSEAQVTNLALPNNYVSFAKLSPELQARIIADENNILALQTYSSVNLGAGTNIDWTVGNVFYSNLSTSPVSYTMTNLIEGKTLVVCLTNTTASNVTVNFPGTVKWPGGLAVIDILAGKSNLYTFICINGSVMATAIEEY